MSENDAPDATSDPPRPKPKPGAASGKTRLDKTPKPDRGAESKAARLEARAAKLRADAERDRAASTGTGERRWRIAAIAFAAVLVVVIALGVVYVVHLRNENDDAARSNRLDDLRRSAATTAKQYAVDFGSYDYRRLDADFAKVSKHLTPTFRRTYQQSSSRLKPTIEQYKGRSTARVGGVGVTEVSTNKATVVLFLDQTVSTTQSKTPRVDRNRVQMVLVRQKNSWLISKLDLV